MAVQCSICLGSSSSLNVETSPFSSIPCGHVYHFACISQWLQSAGKCPECRTPCSSQKVVRLFLKHESQSADISISDAAAEYAQQWIEKCQTKARECEQALHEVNEQKLLLEKSNEHIKNLERTCSARQSEIQQYKERMTVLSGTRMKLEKSREENEKLRKECKTWRDEAEKLQRVSCVMTGSVTDVKGMLANIQSNADFTAVRDSLMCCIEALKMEMEKMKSNDKEMRDETAKSRSHQVKLDEQFKSMVNKNKHLLEELRERDERIKRLELKICTLEKLLKERPDVPQTQVKRFIHESPMPADIVFCSPSMNPSNSSSSRNTDNSPHPMFNTLISSPADTQSIVNILDSPDEPLRSGKKIFAKPRDNTKKAKFARSVFGEASPSSPFVSQSLKSLSTLQQRLPFRKMVRKENHAVASFSLNCNTTIELDD